MIAAAYLAAHFALPAPSLEDIDSINFALGLRQYDIAKHQPHPPGYPVYIALGRVALSAVEAAAPSLERVRAEALALSLWSAIGGAIVLLAAYRLFRALGGPEGAPDEWSHGGLAAWSVALLAVTPLFWMSGERPLSDLPGLASAVTAQWLLLSGGQRRSRLLVAAVLAGVAVGIRVQTAVLTMPLLAIVMARELRVAPAWTLTRLPLAFAAGSLAWGIPMIVASGGFQRYLSALDFQAGADFAWVDMLWANPTPRRLARSLYETFVMPWASVPLAVAVNAAAAAGVVMTVLRAPRALGWLAVAFGPYVIFHLLFQETVTVRYALPIMVAIAWLVVRGLAPLGRLSPVAAAALTASSAFVALPGGLAYAREPHPAFRAIADMQGATGSDRPYAIYSHHALGRALQAKSPSGVRVVEPPTANEWHGPVDYWKSGGAQVLWFLADSRRTDLALIDPQSRHQKASYRWSVADRPELSGTRPFGADWYRLQDPGWFAGEGWSLTPELGGLAEKARNGIDHRPLEALVRRRPDAMVAIVGARHLGTGADGGVTFTISLDDRDLERWSLDPAHGPNAVHVVHLPAESLVGAGAYARFAIRAEPLVPGRSVPPVAIRQFDIQPASGFVYAFDQGWHEEEFENMTGLRWRWSSGQSALRVVPAQGIQIRMRGESPLKYLGEVPTARVTAGGRTISELRPADDFTWNVTVSAEDVRRSDGVVTLEVRPVYLPGKAEGTSDTRELGLRLFEIEVYPLHD